MTDYAELGKRIVVCKHFRFMEGMLTLCGIRLVEGGVDYIIGHRSGPTSQGGGWVDTIDLEGIYPDLSDAATKGCVTKLVRELWPKEKWTQLGRSHSEIMKKLTWLGGPGTEEVVLLSLFEQAGDIEEVEEKTDGR